MRVLSKRTVLTINDKIEDNIILIDKPVDWSSFDVVKKVRGIGKFNKAGHSGLSLLPFQAVCRAPVSRRPERRGLYAALATPHAVDEQCDRDGKPDDRDVVRDQMQMREIHIASERW